jgi:hypothetical protein
VTVADITLEGAATIVDDYSFEQPASLTLAPGAFFDLVLVYDEDRDPGVPNDAAPSAASVNVNVTHDGAGGLTTVFVDVVPPA